MHPSYERIVSMSLIASLLFIGSQSWLDTRMVRTAAAGGVEDAPLRPGTVTIVTMSRLKEVRSDIDLNRTFDLDVTEHPFETYPGEHPPRVYRVRWKGWTEDGWRQFQGQFEVNGATIVMPLWRADGTVRITYLTDHLSERRYWK